MCCPQGGARVYLFAVRGVGRTCWKRVCALEDGGIFLAKRGIFLIVIDEFLLNIPDGVGGSSIAALTHGTRPCVKGGNRTWVGPRPPPRRGRATRSEDTALHESVRSRAEAAAKHEADNLFPSEEGERKLSSVRRSEDTARERRVHPRAEAASRREGVRTSAWPSRTARRVTTVKPLPDGWPPQSLRERGESARCPAGRGVPDILPLEGP